MSIEVQISKLIEALDKNTTALNQLAGQASNAAAATTEATPAKAKPGRPRKEAASPAPAVEPEGNGLDDDPPPDAGDGDELGGDAGDGLGDDPEPEEKPAKVKVTKELMRETMLKYQGLTDGNAARELLKANTSTKSVAFNTVKEAEYEQVYKATLKAIAAKSKK